MYRNNSFDYQAYSIPNVTAITATHTEMNTRHGSRTMAPQACVTLTV